MTFDPNATTAARLDALERRLNAIMLSSQRRNTSTIILGALSVVLIGYWLYYAHHRFANEVTPQLAAKVGQAVIEDYLPTASAQLQTSLEANAPHVIDEGETQLHSVPERLDDAFRTQVRSTLDQEMPQVEDRLYVSMKSGLAQAQEESEKTNLGKSDEERFRGMLAALAVIYGAETAGFVDQVHADYVKNSGDIINGLNLLAEGKNLTSQQQSQRNLIRDALILARETSVPDEKVTIPTTRPVRPAADVLRY
jgi:hypothetical protein